MYMLGLDEAMDKIGKANRVKSNGHVLKKDGDVLRKTLEFKLDDEKGRPKITWRTQVEKEIGKVGLKQEDASNRTTWRKGVKKRTMR